VHGRGPRWLAPLAVVLIWGVNVPVMKGALEHAHAFGFNAARLTASVLVLGILDRLERRGEPAPATPWRAVLLLALMTSLLYQVLFSLGITRTSATHAGFLIASGPLWTAGIASAVGLERLGRRAWIALAIAFVGTCTVVVAKGGGGTVTRADSLAGNGILLASMLVWALGTILTRPVLAEFPATRLAYLTTLVALPGHWLLGWRHLAAEWRGFTPGIWGAVLYSGALSTGIAYSLWNRSLLRIGPARTSAFTNLVPLIALVVAWGTLGERLSALQLLGGALVWIGLGTWRSARR